MPRGASSKPGSSPTATISSWCMDCRKTDVVCLRVVSGLIAVEVDGLEDDDRVGLAGVALELVAGPSDLRRVNPAFGDVVVVAPEHRTDVGGVVPVGRRHLPGPSWPERDLPGLRESPSQGCCDESVDGVLWDEGRAHAVMVVMALFASHHPAEEVMTGARMTE
jgi:hypothetical protein